MAERLAGATMRGKETSLRAESSLHMNVKMPLKSHSRWILPAGFLLVAAVAAACATSGKNTGTFSGSSGGGAGSSGSSSGGYLGSGSGTSLGGLSGGIASDAEMLLDGNVALASNGRGNVHRGSHLRPNV
jgi:hypothetical protein